ncbi:FRG domain-containing protein [Niveibacterium sp. 24ML]|uniref:FRG domain-containing protein n=1 Tax=Niveibacterium sp. 24ML TaxID=2985512 RepID=UPI00226EC741|nr:FRG domain-containing protein [Niveibacterium sp. 24ML]MCX9155753.1 FRG domain-containing protein [Niveibacterium sp. 24ML]
MREIPAESKTIESVAQAIDAVARGKLLDTLAPEASARRGDARFGLWFRGHERASYRLVPGLLRPNAGSAPVDEVSLTRHFRALNPDAVPAGTPDFAALVTMQHYLAPTRLLDWTENLLVALFFAVRDPQLDESGEDAALWILNARRLNYYSSASRRSAELLYADDADVIARAALCRVRNRDEWHDSVARSLHAPDVAGEAYRHTRLLGAIGDTPIPVSQIASEPRALDLRAVPLTGARGEKPGNLFDDSDWAAPERLALRLSMPVAVFPPRGNPRIRNQSGTFTLHGGRYVADAAAWEGKDRSPSAIGAPIDLLDIDAALRRTRILKWLRVPTAKRAGIRRELALIGMTEAALFPELDYQSRHVAERWSPPREANGEH